MGRTTIAVYGGSFDPPHVGHALVMAWTLWTRQADQVWLVPTFRHAFEKSLAPFEERLALCRAMAADVHDAVEVLTLEQELPVPSYTVETLRVLRQQNPDADFRLLVGADILRETAKWRDWDVIASEFSPIVAGRAGYPQVPGAPSFPGISSTALRTRLRTGQSVTGLVTASVCELLPGTYGATV
jgi:nicotinate-nucleotide adenylyltransferase